MLGTTVRSGSGHLPARLAPLLLGALAALSPGCGRDDSGTGRLPTAPPLRVVVRPEPIEFLPRNADPVMLDRDIAAGLADALGRPLRLVHAEDYSSMIALLESGEADVVAANLTATEGRRARVPFSLPYLHTDEILVMREDEPAPSKRAEMNGLVVTVRRSSAYAETLERIRERNAPDLAVDWAPENVAVEALLERVEEGSVQATVVDSHVWKAVSGHFPRLTPVLRLARDRPIALALRPDDPELKRRADQFLIRRALTGPREEVYTDDLSGLKERRRLRMITRNNAATYFLHRGAQLGFEYELLRRFADAQGLRLEIVIPPNRTALVQWLLEGRGDVVSASLTPTEERAARVRFTDPYLEVAEFVVVRSDEADGIRGPADLAGREVWVRASSTYFQAAEELKGEVPDLRIALVPEDMETEEVLARVEEGTWDLTIAESHHLEIARHGGMDLSAAFSLGEGVLAWAVRPDNPELAEALNAYLRGEIRGLFYNVIRERYFGDTKDIVRAHDEWRSDVSGRISPWDDLAREYAGRYELDWRLVLAQMYEESRFDPDRVSWAGAQGLMQVLPRTAREMGTGDPRDPESSVHGGTKYLRWLIDSFDPRIPLAERIRFALAGYNAGRGHVVDARRLAERLDLDPDKWYGNVEQAIVLLQRPEYYEQTRYGYCRGTMARHYVREIERRYEAYVAHVPAGQALAGTVPVPGAEDPAMSAAGSDTTFAAEAGSE